MTLSLMHPQLEPDYCRCFTCRTDEETRATYLLVVDCPEGQHLFATPTVDVADLVGIAASVFVGTATEPVGFQERADCCRVRIVPVESPNSVALYAEVLSSSARQMFRRGILFDPPRLAELIATDGRDICRGCLRDGLADLEQVGNADSPKADPQATAPLKLRRV